VNLVASMKWFLLLLCCLLSLGSLAFAILREQVEEAARRLADMSDQMLL
jgi:hypothetical protein